jgi:hypothetical protein
LSSLRWHCAPRRSGQAPGCGVVACLAQAVTVLWHRHLTVHSSRTGFASRLNSGVSPHENIPRVASILKRSGGVRDPPPCRPRFSHTSLTESFASISARSRRMVALRSRTSGASSSGRALRFTVRARTGG